MSVQNEIPRSLYGTVLRHLDSWTPGQYVASAELDGTERTVLAEAEKVPNAALLRRQDRVWHPHDHDRLPVTDCVTPGYTILRGVHLLPGGLALAGDGRFVRDDRTRLTPPTLSPAFARHLSAGPEGRSTWPVAPEMIEKGILISGPGSMVYGHQLLDYLPGLALLDDLDAFADWPVLIRHDTPRWVISMIEKFIERRRERKFISGSALLRSGVGEVCVPWIVRRPSFHPIVRRVFGRLVDAACKDGR